MRLSKLIAIQYVFSLIGETLTRLIQAILQIIGYAIVGITFSLQPVMRWACEKLEGFWRIIVADVFLFVSFVGTVNGKEKLEHLENLEFDNLRFFQFGEGFGRF